MAMINCPECGKQISDKAASCPNCGAPVAAASNVAIPVWFERKKAGLADMAGADGSIIVDGVPSGTLLKGGRLCVYMMPGVHQILTRINVGFGSNIPKDLVCEIDVPIDAKEGHVVCKAKKGLVSVSLDIENVTFE